MSKTIEQRSADFFPQCFCHRCFLEDECARTDEEGIENLPTSSWIPVTEHSMPQCYRIDDCKRSHRLLFVTKEKDIHIGYYDWYPIGEWVCEDESLDIPCPSGRVTHWMPLPEVPDQ